MDFISITEFKDEMIEVCKFCEMSLILARVTIKTVKTVMSRNQNQICKRMKHWWCKRTMKTSNLWNEVILLSLSSIWKQARQHQNRQTKKCERSAA